MRAIRVYSVVAIVLLAVYHALRLAAAGCSGAQCDYFIPVSLAAPAAVLVVAGISGWMATQDARLRHSAWLGPLAVATLLSVLGPPAVVALFRDQPDAVVAGGTVLLLLAPVAALAYSFRSSPSRNP
ncbi:MAG TPA: hypothetical protein VET26_07060 [Candidatus Sulfotelmatobacter sp.]|nr:hypothetical protein [Candidatus Sulfotelmatobacter sp.]